MTARPIATDCRWPPERLATCCRIERIVVTASDFIVAAVVASISGSLSRRMNRAPRGRGTCSARCRGCRRGRDPGRRPRSRARRSRAGCAMVDLLAVEVDLAAVDRVDPGDALDQRRLAGAVVADERHDLARPYLEVDIRQRLHRAEALRDISRLERRRRGGCLGAGEPSSRSRRASRDRGDGGGARGAPPPRVHSPSSTACTSRCRRPTS